VAACAQQQQQSCDSQKEIEGAATAGQHSSDVLNCYAVEHKCLHL
jgi:hypothetical protein